MRRCPRRRPKVDARERSRDGYGFPRTALSLLRRRLRLRLVLLVRVVRRRVARVRMRFGRLARGVVRRLEAVVAIARLSDRHTSIRARRHRIHGSVQIIVVSPPTRIVSSSSFRSIRRYPSMLRRRLAYVERGVRSVSNSATRGVPLLSAGISAGGVRPVVGRVQRYVHSAHTRLRHVRARAAKPASHTGLHSELLPARLAAVVDVRGLDAVHLTVDVPHR